MHILQVSSIGGISAFANIGMYNASKWALEGFSQSLAQEVAGFGIKVTLIEPAGYATDWGGASARHATPVPGYEEFRIEAAQARAARVADPGDPVATRDAVLTLVDSDDPPLRIFFGDGPLAIATKDYESRLATWEPLSIAAYGTQARAGSGSLPFNRAENASRSLFTGYRGANPCSWPNNRPEVGRQRANLNDQPWTRGGGRPGGAFEPDPCSA